jgi:hypothetical protein
LKPIIIPGGQGDDDWIKERLGHATASNFSEITSKPTARSQSPDESTGRANYRVRLALEILTGVAQKEDFQSKFTRAGTDLEPFARTAYGMKTGHEVDEVRFVRHAELRAGASPDGLVGEDGLIEIKCGVPTTHLEYLKLTNEPPSTYAKQIYGLLWITQRKWCDFVSYQPDFPVDLRLHVVRIHRDEAVISMIEQAVRLFISDVDRTVEELKALSKRRAE